MKSWREVDVGLECSSSRGSVTRLITLDAVTRVDAASDFFGESNVPRTAITMGLATILGARRILLVAFGESKASIAARAIEGPVCEDCAASFLQEHRSVKVFLDAAAAAGDCVPRLCTNQRLISMQ